jgi:hypothetical protein
VTVLGGGGFLGSAIGDQLLAEGHAVRVLERPRNQPHRVFAAKETVDWLAGDFGQLADVKKALKDASAVVHLAWSTRPKSSNDAPILDVQSNVVATLQLLEEMRSQGIQKILFASSGGTVYGPPIRTPIDEDHPNNAVDYNSPSEDEQALEDLGPTLERDQEVVLTSVAVPEPSFKGKEEAPPSRNSVEPVERKAVLGHSDILRMTSDKNYKFIRALSDHEQQPAGFINSIYNFDDELDGYTSPGGTVRMTKGVANVVFIALAAEAPNTLVLKARQEAFEQIIKQAEAQAKRQQEAYDEQQRRIALEHEDHMTRLRQENDRLLKEATEVRDQFVRSFRIEPTPTVSAVVEAQSRHYYEHITSQMGLRAQRLQDDYESEVKRRKRKEEDLKDAEAKIEKLQ